MNPTTALISVSMQLSGTRLLDYYWLLLFPCLVTDSTPSLVELLSFPASQGRTINIPQEIGTKYNTFGILLLKDRTGALVDGIVHKHLRDPVLINIEILQKWVHGESGELPVSWRTLITCLRDSGMSVLASDIQQALL